MATASLVAAFIAPPLGVVLAILSLRDMRSRQERGRGFAVAAIVVGGMLSLLFLTGLVWLVGYFVLTLVMVAALYFGFVPY